MITGYRSVFNLNPTNKEYSGDTLMYYAGKKDGQTLIECDQCGMVHPYDDQLFSQHEINYCISNAPIFCPECGNQAAAGMCFNTHNTFIPKPIPTASYNSVTCPRCGGRDCQPINEQYTSGGGYDAGNGCCGYLLLGPIGLLCGACGSETKTTNVLYWVCKNCGHKFRR